MRFHTPGKVVTRVHLISSSVLALALCACAPDSNTPVTEPDWIPPTTNKPERFQAPNPTPSEIDQILSKYAYVDPNREVPTNLLKDALIYYDYNKSLIGNTSVLSVVDFHAFSGTKRFFIINMTTGAVWATYVAHGKNSDPHFTGYATHFSNVIGSDESSLGFYLTEETYSGIHGYSMRLDGLSRTNSNARTRAIVLHEAPYIHEANVIQGRSDGCLAVANDVRDQIIDRLKGSSLIYAGLSNER